MTFKEREMAEQLVLAGEGGAAGAAPLCLLTAVAQVTAEIGKNSKTLLTTAALASIELGAVAAAEVVARADRRLEWPEAAMHTVTVAPSERARESHISAGSWLRLAGTGEGVKGLELVAVRTHVHPEVGVAAEALAADIAEVDMLREQLVGVELHDIVAPIALDGFQGRSLGGGGRGGKLLDRSRRSRRCRRWRWGGKGEGGRKEGGGVEDYQVSGGRDLGGD
jgi:hypothetical protein